MDVSAGPVTRPGLRVAAVLDEFSYYAFRYEADLTELDRRYWRAQLDEARPALLLVESAWEGKDGSWHKQIANADGPGDEVVQLVESCRERGIPTVFWNKEDPSNYNRFIRATALFDHVFTTDKACVPRYRRDLGHDRVGCLPFAAQPRVHNPIQTGEERPHGVAFAGSYYTNKHEDRRRQLELLLAAAKDVDLDIFSRVAVDPNYAFPERYQPYLRGTLSYVEMLEAHRRYRIFLNINSATDSPTMCSRRVFEVLAAGAMVVSTPSRALDSHLPGLVFQVDSEYEARAALRSLLGSETFRARHAVRAIRHILASHTYRHRLSDVLAALAIPDPIARPTVSAILPVHRPGLLDAALELVARQTIEALQLVVVLDRRLGREREVADRARRLGLDAVDVVTVPDGGDGGQMLGAALAAATGDLVALMDDACWYGPHYLADKAAMFDYADASIVGKRTHFTRVTRSGDVILRHPNQEFRYTDLVDSRTLLVRRSAFDTTPVPRAAHDVGSAWLAAAVRDGYRVLSADRFNFYDEWPAGAVDRGTTPWSVMAEGIVETCGDAVGHATA